MFVGGAAPDKEDDLRRLFEQGPDEALSVCAVSDPKQDRPCQAGYQSGADHNGHGEGIYSSDFVRR